MLVGLANFTETATTFEDIVQFKMTKIELHLVMLQ